MSVRMFLYNWNHGQSGKAIAHGLGIKQIKHKNSRYVPDEDDIIINWGINPVTWEGIRTINPSSAVRNTVDKKKFFKLYEEGCDFKVPKFWFDKELARQWLYEGEGTRTLVCRTITNGHEGAGIVLTTNPLDVPDAPLYTEYVKKKAEYRVHVMNGEVIDYTQKKRKAGHIEGDSRIRNTANGYIFCRTDVVVPPSVLSSALAAVKFYGLDFGAVDVIWNDHYQQAYVLEINSAPGIEGTTLNKYIEGFKKWLM